MRFLIRVLQGITALALAIAVMLWFAARRGDRGMIEEEVTIASAASSVFRWISSEELASRWISDVIELRKSDSGGTPSYKIIQLVNGHPLEMNVRVARVIPNQELTLLTASGNSAAEGFSGDANFQLISGDDYTRLVFHSHTQFVSLTDRLFEPVLTIAMQRKLHNDLARLKMLIEAEQERSSSPRGSQETKQNR